MAGVDPAVEAPGEGVGHAVRVAVAEGAVEHLAAVGPAVAVAVAVARNVGDAVDDGALAQRQHADRNVEPVGEGRDFAARPSAGILQDANRVAGRTPSGAGTDTRSIR